MFDMQGLLSKAVKKLSASSRTVAITGAGISVESGIPAFRGENGIWNRYDPMCIEIQYFLKNPLPAWNMIHEVFYQHFAHATPNAAHISLARLEELGLLDTIITQNIDHLHQEAGSKKVIEYHGSNHILKCITCGRKIKFEQEMLKQIPPKCPECHGILKPDFVFFGEEIPRESQISAWNALKVAEICLVIGTSGEVFPACDLPFMAKKNGAYIIEINTSHSRFTSEITDLFLQGRASEILTNILARLNNNT